ncbi:hypothetical protein [Halapricum hydrolyticum]|uniref:Uncharacterized protein n=1 Tax=Halapricum hydrolyticum TaxID=2979991 RepID=A0AAE3I8E7_9EURY|nr:hypothetical protein [Halapricum hydrolyticum]MCU4716820.1 hypothetical protein [Halapricum hydrolyticum]MCU4725575.1 hypothetical protein [Halapricum hydrolyticum]
MTHDRRKGNLPIFSIVVRVGLGTRRRGLVAVGVGPVHNAGAPGAILDDALKLNGVDVSGLTHADSPPIKKF